MPGITPIPDKTTTPVASPANDTPAASTPPASTAAVATVGPPEPPAAGTPATGSTGTASSGGKTQASTEKGTPSQSSDNSSADSTLDGLLQLRNTQTSDTAPAVNSFPDIINQAEEQAFDPARNALLSDFDRLVQQAQNGDAEATAKLQAFQDQMAKRAVQAAQPLKSDEVQRQEEIAKREQRQEGKKEDKLSHAIQEERFLSTYVRRSREYSSRYGQEGKTQLAELLQAGEKKAEGARENLQRDIHAYEQRRAGDGTESILDRFAKLLWGGQKGTKTAPRGQEAKSAQATTAAEHPAFTARGDGLVEDERGHFINPEETPLATKDKGTPKSPKKADQGGHAAPQEEGGEIQVAKGEQTEGDGPKKPAKAGEIKEGEAIQEEVAGAYAVVEGNVSKKLRKFREGAREAGKKVVASAESAFLAAKKEVNQLMSSEKSENPSLIQGAKAMVARVAEKYRKVQEQAFGDLCSGKSSLCGLVYLDHTVGAEPAAPLHGGTSASRIIQAMPGSEEFASNLKKWMGIQPNSKEKFTSDLDLKRDGGILGYFSGWVPPSKRREGGTMLGSDAHRLGLKDSAVGVG